MRATHVTRLLGSKVAQRMVMLFVGCWPFMMIALAIVSYKQISGLLYDTSLDRRHQASKSVGMDVMSRLGGVESELTLLASSLQVNDDGRVTMPPVALSRLKNPFVGLAAQRGADLQVFTTSPTQAATITESERKHLSAGKTVLRLDPTGRLTAIREIPAIGGEIIADVSLEYLWGNGDLAPPTMNVLVLGPQGQMVLPPPGDNRPRPPDALVEGAKAGALGEVEWSAEDDERLGSYWTIPLAFDFLLPRMTVFVSEPRSVAMAAATSGTTSFIMVALLSLLLVLLLALVQVKRSLVPLDQLEAGTQRLSAGDFDRPVLVTSGDEFEGLADAFNSMTGQLKRQFRVLSARSALDRAVLSSLDEDTILSTALQGLPDLVTVDFACIVTFANFVGEDAHALIAAKGQGAPRVIAPPSKNLPSVDSTRLSEKSSIAFRSSDAIPIWASPLSGAPWARAVAFPLKAEGRIVGVLTVASLAIDGLTQDDELQLRRMADQLAVALSNARLMGALDRLNVGTLTALGRTVDAKSPWTAGHAQRVATMATDLGRILSVGDPLLDILNRGSLLHDIGKIAVPSSILNKPAKLTDEEYAVMKEHPAVGARILEPIPEYHTLIPIVRQHHEWFDGRGYPDGLSGDDISFEARIVAVSDVFDAVTSKRPYRDGLGLQRSIEIIRDGSGTQFDPAVVKAFMSLMDSRGKSEADHAA